MRKRKIKAGERQRQRQGKVCKCHCLQGGQKAAKKRNLNSYMTSLRVCHLTASMNKINLKNFAELKTNPEANGKTLSRAGHTTTASKFD